MIKYILRITTLMFTILMYARADAQVYNNMADFEVRGTLATTASNRYSRLPDSLKNKVRKGLWDLGQNTAGMYIRFSSDASSIYAKWTPLNGTVMNHMCATGIRGLDLYVLTDEDEWVFAGSAIPSKSGTATIIKGLPKKMREYMLFLPLYDGLSDLSIGVNSGAKLLPPTVDLPVRDKPIVMYGTSILQGGCASRPGMAHTNILMRDLNHEIINLGFSGNAHLDPEIAQIMAASDASIFVIDVLPNNTVTSIEQKLEPFYRIIRKSHPDTPIILVDNPMGPRTRIDEGNRKGILSLNNAQKRFYERMVSEGDTNLYYVDAMDILNPDLEGTVDGIHFTDLGFSDFADSLYPLLDAILHGEVIQ